MYEYEAMRALAKEMDSEVVTLKHWSTIFATPHKRGAGSNYSPPRPRETLYKSQLTPQQDRPPSGAMNALVLLRPEELLPRPVAHGSDSRWFAFSPHKVRASWRPSCLKLWWSLCVLPARTTSCHPTSSKCNSDSIRMAILGFCPLLSSAGCRRWPREGHMCCSKTQLLVTPLKNPRVAVWELLRLHQSQHLTTQLVRLQPRGISCVGYR